jgi:hypothetical protein
MPGVGRQGGLHVIGVVVRHRPHDGQPVGEPGRSRQHFAELHSRQGGVDCVEFPPHGRRAVGLRIERFLLRMPAVQVQHDDLFGSAERSASDRSVRAMPQQVDGREAQPAESAEPQHFATAQPGIQGPIEPGHFECFP